MNPAIGVKKIQVVAGVIERATARTGTTDREILIARRKPGMQLAGFWEFPGGKVEPGELPENSLKRELFEEFSVSVEVGEFIASSYYEYEFAHIFLHAYWARHISGEFQLIAHDQLRWVLPSELKNYQLAPADIPFIEFLLR